MATFEVEEAAYNNAKAESTKRGFKWVEGQDAKGFGLYLQPAQSVQGNPPQNAFLWTQKDYYSHVSFLWKGWTLYETHFTIRAGPLPGEIKGNRLFLRKPNGYPITVAALPSLADPENAPNIKKSLVGAMTAYEGTPTYDQFKTILTPPGFEWVPGAQDIYLGQVRAMLDEVVKICKDFKMKDNTEIPDTPR